MFRPVVNSNALKCLITPGQGIVSREALEFLKPFLNRPRIIEMMELTDQITELPISSIIRGSPELNVQRTSIQQPLIILLNSIQNHIVRDNYGVDLYGMGDYCIGHSVGEITNLALQGSIDFEKLINIGHKRGKLMETVAHDGDYKMYVLVINRKDFGHVTEQIKKFDNISISNINTDEQIVISGTRDHCEELIQMLSQFFKIRKKIDLQVAIPFHNPVLTPIVDDIRSLFQDAGIKSELRIPSILNLDLAVCDKTADYVEKILQVTDKTVNFKSCIDAVLSSGKEVIFINYSSVTKNLVQRYCKSLSIPVKSFSLDTSDNIDELVLLLS